MSNDYGLLPDALATGFCCWADSAAAAAALAFVCCRGGTFFSTDDDDRLTLTAAAAVDAAETDELVRMTFLLTPGELLSAEELLIFLGCSSSFGLTITFGESAFLIPPGSLIFRGSVFLVSFSTECRPELLRRTRPAFFSAAAAAAQLKGLLSRFWTAAATSVLGGAAAVACCCCASELGGVEEPPLRTCWSGSCLGLAWATVGAEELSDLGRGKAEGRAKAASVIECGWNQLLLASYLQNNQYLS